MAKSLTDMGVGKHGNNPRRRIKTGTVRLRNAEDDSLDDGQVRSIKTEGTGRIGKNGGLKYEKYKSHGVKSAGGYLPDEEETSGTD